MNHTMAALCDTCPPRYYCVNKDRADPCPEGHYCPGTTGFDTELCPRGTYGPTEMLESADECTQCDGGYYCDMPGLSTMTGFCAPGYYCQYGVDTATPDNNNTGFGGKLNCYFLKPDTKDFVNSVFMTKLFRRRLSYRALLSHWHS